MTDLVQEVSKKLGPMTRVARKSTYNPRTKQFYGFPETYAPDPVQYRRSFLQEAGVSLNTWEDLRKGAPKLKQIGHPVGLGMSNEIDSNMLLTSLLYCYGGFIQNEENRIVIGQGANRRGAIQALEVMRDIYRNGMSDEVFAWTAASNNQAFLAGRLSVALNAISIARSAEDSGQPGAVRRHVARLDPARPRDAPRQRARDGRLPDLEVREEQGGGAEVRRRPAARLPRALHSQRVLQLPAVDGGDQGRVQDDPDDHRAGRAQAEGQVHGPDDDRREVHDEPRPSRATRRR